MKQLLNKILILFFILSIESLEASKAAPRKATTRWTAPKVQPKWEMSKSRRDAIITSLKVKASKPINQKRFETIRAEQKQQGVHIPARFNKEKMEVPIHKYAEEVGLQIRQKHGKGSVPKEVLAPMERAYAVEHIASQSGGYAGAIGSAVGVSRAPLTEALGHNRTSVKSVSLGRESLTQANQKMLSSGVEALYEVHQNKSFNRKKYEQSAKKQMAELQQKFPSSSKAMIETYLTESLNHQFTKQINGKEYVTPRKDSSSGQVSLSVTNRPELTAAESAIAYDPTPISRSASAQVTINSSGRVVRLQKMYDSMTAMESIAQNAKAVHDIRPINVYSAPRKAIYEPQRFFNEGLQLAGETGSSILLKSLQPQVASTTPAFKLSPEARRAVEQLQKDIVTVGTEHAVRAADGAAQSYGFKASVRNPQKFQQEALNAGIQRVAPKVTEALRTPAKAESKSVLTNKTQRDLTNTLEAGLEAAGILAPKPVVNRTPTTAARTIQKTFREKRAQKKAEKIEARRNESARTIQRISRGRQSRIRTTNTKTKAPAGPSTINTFSITGYFTKRFKKVAEAMPRTPEALKNLTNRITESISNILRLSKSDKGKLNRLGEREVEYLIKDKNSWINAKPENFKPTFERWMRRFVGKCYSTIGRPKPKKSQIITVNEHSSHSPKITLNTSANVVTSAIITYEGRSYQGEVAKQPDGTYTITAPLTRNLTRSGRLIDRGVNALTQPIKSALPETTALLQRSLTGNKTANAGNLNISYDPKTQSIVTKTTTVGAGEANIITTKTYSKGESKSVRAGDTNIATTKTHSKSKSKPVIEQSKTIAIEAIKEAQFSTNIQLSTNTNGVQSFNVTYTNEQTGKKYEFKAKQQDVALDPNTGTYTINAKFKAPEKLTPSQELGGKLAQSAWDGLGHGLQKTYTFSMLRNKYNEAYNATGTYLTGEYPTAISGMTIKYNPAKKTIVTQATQIMSKGPDATVSATYPVG